MVKKINKLVSKKTLVFVLLILIIFGGFVVRLYKINSPIADWHSWRQADTASVTRTFLERGVDLLHPKYHDISRVQSGYFNPEGYRYVEFPIYNLVHVSFVKLYPSLGLEVWGRIVSIFCALFTSVFLFLIARKYLGDFGGLLSAFFYLFIPFNIYFTRVILPDPMAVMLSMGAIYFFYQFTESENKILLIFSACLFSLAMLTKPHSIFFSLPIVYLVFHKYGVFGSLKDKWLFVAINIVLIPFLMWRIWMYSPGLIRGIPEYLWAFNGDNIRFRPSFWRWLFGMRIGTLILGTWGIGPFFSGLLYFNKKTLLTFTFITGVILYFVIFATANVKHDYYQIFIIPAIAITSAQGVVYLFQILKLNKIVISASLLFVLGMMLGLGWFEIRANYQVNNYAIIEAGNAVDKLAPEDALIIAPYNGDTAFLYQTGRWGWPVITEDIKDMIAQGADYYVSVDLGSSDTKMLKEKYHVVRVESSYIIIDLNDPVSI